MHWPRHLSTTTPLAGRIVPGPTDGELHVACTGEGVWFVKAAASCTLEDVNYLDRRPLMISDELLIPSPPPGIEQTELSFLMQVTEFKCGGFAVGYVNSHMMLDAVGLGQFIGAICEMARGLAQPTIGPVWCREAIPVPINQIKEAPSTPTPTPFVLEHHTMDVSLERINQLKNQFMQETGQRCSAFDILAAKIWQCRTRAIGAPPRDEVTLNFPANLRRELRGRLPPEGGYYGNCFCDIMVEATSEKIAKGPFFDVVRMIKEAKESFLPETSGWFRGDRIIRYGKLSLSDLRRVGFFEADFGWGPPDHVVPLMNHPIGLCNIVNSPVPDRSIRLLTQCVAKEHLEAFKEEMNQLA
ncbi:putative 3'-N-debenzoyl-2'-deoxytaxol N-benzoyltransferase [Iris pallida]|uniref:3'-N-debenzoyl-2'-deoxytaxol N-benzoyltransferase n=1 Tax=Iris pallida TaxID=29817 RepID=A0AAX6HH98_IRIPA|nr:putative 3'-N-debenzoyl-2'-deoxytaxol N-benzoyltransferase [Iris pallida]